MSNRIKKAFSYKENNKQIIKKIPDDILYTRNSIYGRDTLKVRIIADDLIPYICAICYAEPYWNGKDLVLVLDHINGANNDNRLENLRFLCPNCNSQTETFSKNVRYRKTMVCEGIDENFISPMERICHPFEFED